jgi:hypothetical protein
MYHIQVKNRSAVSDNECKENGKIEEAMNELAI